MKLLKLSLVGFVLACGLYGCGSKVDDQTEEQRTTAQVTFTNPIADGADPWVFKKDGIYYYCGSGDGGIYVSQSEKMTDPGERRTVWKAPEEGWNKMNIWAPELHFIEGKWYIYYAAGEGGPPFIHQRPGA